MAVGGGPVVHGYPHLETVRAAITALYKRLSHHTVRTFDTSVAPADVAFGDQDDLHLGAQRVAREMVRHLRLPDARVIVGFREMRHAASVELAAGPEYFVELNDRFRTHRRDIGAALAHEVMHVYLHRLGLTFPGDRDNEILTDTAAAYLGAGWLLLDAYREDGVSSQKLGYLTPEEYGYVLAKRALVFGEAPETWFTSAQAYTAYTKGLDRARHDERQPPLAAAGWAGRRRYAKDRRYAEDHGAAGAGGVRDAGGYVFSGAGRGALRVAFPCPVCRQRLRVPVRGRVRVRCGLCGTVLECDT
ncbi:SprT-like domain-containing protein OS=Streptomyces alboniger OX=132473 GN=CP975_08760 PE=4 SV=1 [Streptomyces alboniger]